MVKFSPGDDYSSTSKRPRLSLAEEAQPVMPQMRGSEIKFSGSGSDTSTGMVALIDPETLDCCICMEPLSAPVFQVDDQGSTNFGGLLKVIENWNELSGCLLELPSCLLELLGYLLELLGCVLELVGCVAGLVGCLLEQCSNGHIACSKCCELLYNKCHSCAKPIGKIRCLAIEKVIESVKVGCKYSCSGCTEMVRYSERRDHESKCRYEPYLCPVSGCSFTASSKLFPDHFTTVHGATAIQFSYDAWFTVTMDTDEPFFILEGEDMVFLIQNKMKPLGNLIHITYFGPVSLEEQYSYKIEIKKEKRRLTMESLARSIVGICETLQDFLLVPIETYEENGQFTFEISFHHL